MNWLRYIYTLSNLVVTTAGSCFLLILTVMGLLSLTEPTFKAQPDFTAITTPGWTYFWLISLVIFIGGSLARIIYHFIKNDNEETKK